jgi:hypothetical protein
MKDQWKAWIADGRVEEVLNELVKITDDALVVKSSYVSAKRRYNLGTLDQRDWTLAQNTAAQSALYLINRYAPEGGVAAPTEKPIIAEKPVSKAKASVFLSYNHGDSAVADRIQALLEAQGFDVKRDKDDMAIGEDIQVFIDRMLRAKGFVLSVISKNSLSSGWVGIESNLAKYAEFFGVSRFIPVMIDRSLFEDNLVFEILDKLDPQIQAAETYIARCKKAGIEYEQFEAKRKRLVTHRSQISGLIHRLQSARVEDVSEGKFEEGMKRVVLMINGE